MSYVSYISYVCRLYELLKSLEVILDIVFSVFKNFSTNFRECIRNIRIENIERKFLKNMQKNQSLKAKNSLLELGRYFIELKDRVVEDRGGKIKREIEELLSNWLLCLWMILISLEKKKWRK